MRRFIATGLSVLTAIASLAPTAKVAQASFGDFMWGVGVAAGTSAVINSNRRASEAERRATEAERRATEAERQQSVSPDEEFFRGLQDALNGLPYDNFRATTDYDEGFQEGVRRRQTL
jgi:hypothetical protein